MAKIVENTKKSIYALRILIVEDYTSQKEITEKVEQKIANLELLEEDEDVKEAIGLLRSFLKEIMSYNKRRERLEGEEAFFENALRGQPGYYRTFIVKKMEDIDNKKLNLTL